MPIVYKIDKLSGTVFSNAYGIITNHEAYLHQDKLRDDPDFEPSFAQLVDCMNITNAENLSTEAIHHLAERNPFGLGSKRAFVTSMNLMYGLGRMFQMLTDDHPDEPTVFRDMQEARKYLSLD